MKTIDIAGKDVTVSFRKSEGFAIIVTNQHIQWKFHSNRRAKTLEEFKTEWKEYHFSKKLSNSQVLKFSRKLIKQGCQDLSVFDKYQRMESVRIQIRKEYENWLTSLKLI